MKLLEALRNSVQRLEVDLKDSNLIDHMGDRGEFRERVVKRFLRPYLPPCYGLGSGTVFSETDEVSKQIDVVVFDDVFSNVLFRDDPNSVYPCEAVYGSIEVKSYLDSARLSLALENIASLKCLPRGASHWGDILPFRRLEFGRGLEFDRSMANPYLGIVFAYDGLAPEAVAEELNSRAASTEAARAQLPELVVNVKRGYTICRWRQVGSDFHPVPLGQPFDVFHHIQTRGDTLPLFFLTTNIMLNQIRLRAPDLNAYWLSLVNEVIATQTAVGEQQKGA